ncbi:hypothetical protein DRF75_02510 [Ehrlichia minasensis]|uniref:Exonuclease VII large subunit C-terminal domain-containing protein n=1 Tax=Ehrlichia minasensis TaxID=1242993 RepID=A0A4V2BQP8_9RICK|nr:exodeoxyribonuclease VII large subunit [Ehrlichia minasensis]RZB12734.1 hypothetical protein DRF75_02510 [Ehrlichia minasensis]
MPIVSAIDHEIDFTLIDYTADMHAPTPAVVEIVLPTSTDRAVNSEFNYEIFWLIFFIAHYKM